MYTDMKTSKNNPYGSSYREFVYRLRKMSDEELTKEYDLVQEGVSTLSANERKILNEYYDILTKDEG